MLELLQQFMFTCDPEQLYNWEQDELIQSSILFFWKSKTGEYLGCNEAFASRIGLDNTQKILGHNDFELCWKDSAPSLRLNDLQVINNEKPQMIIETAQLINGNIGKALSYKLPLRLRSTNKITGVIGISIEFNNQEELIPGSFLNSIHFSSLTKRQKECLYYLCKGMSIKQIAKALKLSPRTVEHYLEAVREKLACHSRAQLIEKLLGYQI